MFANALVISLHDMRSICGHCCIKFFMTHRLFFYCFSGDSFDDVDPVLFKHYDALGYDLSLEGRTEQRDDPPVLFFCIAFINSFLSLNV